MYNKPFSEPSPERRLWIREAAGGISRIFLALFVFELVSLALVYAVVFALALFAPSIYVALAESAIFNILLSSVSMYLVAFPIFYLIVRKMRTHRLEKRKPKAGTLLLAF